MTFLARFAIKGADGHIYVFTARPRCELGDEWLAPTARTYHIDFQASLTPTITPTPTPASAFTPVSLVMVRPCGQYHGCGSYHGEIVYNTAWRPVAAISTEEETLSVLEFTEHPPWPINSFIPDRK